MTAKMDRGKLEWSKPSSGSRNLFLWCWPAYLNFFCWDPPRFALVGRRDQKWRLGYTETRPLGTSAGMVHNVGLLSILDLRHSKRRSGRCFHDG